MLGKLLVAAREFADECSESCMYHKVLFKEKAPVKSLFALRIWAYEFLLIIMPFHVICKISELTELFITAWKLTFVRFFASMDNKMLLYKAFQSESFFAPFKWAFVRFFSSMWSHMLLERSILNEGFATSGIDAFVVPLACMNLFMHH